MKLIYRFCMGVFIGAGAILPGISSGVLCVIFGIYDKLISSVLGFFKDIKTNFNFLFPIIFGVGIGIIMFGNILKRMFALYPIQTNFAFIGLILGCVPHLLKIANSRKGFRLHYLIYTFVSFTITIILLILESKFTLTDSSTIPNASFLILSGFVMSAGVVIPRSQQYGFINDFRNL